MSSLPNRQSKARLSPNLLEELTSCVQSVFHDAAAAADSNLRRGAVEAITQSIKDSVATALAELLRRENAGVPRASSKLPDEAWCLIWQLLPTVDLVTIPQVCQSWRTLASASPGIWRQLSFASWNHHQDCLCTICDEGYDCVLDCRECSGRIEADHMNVTFARALLQRSGTLDLALDLKFEVTPRDASYRFGELDAFIRCLQPHLCRLTSLCVRSLRLPEVGRSLLFGCRQFPALQHLEIAGFNASPSAYNGISDKELEHWTAGLSVVLMPSLKSLKVWPELLDGLDLPTVETLECRFIDSDSLLCALSACPNLRVLRLQITLCPGGGSGPHWDMIDTVCERVSTLEQVSAFNIGPRSVDKILNIVHHPALSAVSLQCHSKAAHTAFQIFADITTPFAMFCHSNADPGIGNAVLTIRDTRGHNREVALSRDSVNLSNLWKHVQLEYLTSIDTDDHTWERLTHSIESFVAPAVRDIIIRISARTTAHGIFIAPPDHDGAPRFPALHLLRLESEAYNATWSLKSAHLYDSLNQLRGSPSSATVVLGQGISVKWDQMTPGSLRVELRCHGRAYTIISTCKDIKCSMCGALLAEIVD
ncbi:hypothetical protein EXIGLDRAFT_748234 [Exidia glandulosa HHB12029]|uniref:F-box domain-containing protein n=1 Tax=Exidia glandulosa HHB12029 TaxID=1314781 RepID=A0A165JPR9_EXIGL|nr:hypothetical protein EXIGLDRAFT_748234 [Exidia glandulosa HHB12029]